MEPTSGGTGRGRGRHRLTLVLDPRFPGGTSTAVAAEIAAIACSVHLEVCAIETAMFRGREVNPRLRATLDLHGIDLAWNPPVIRGDTVVLHNPSCLRFNTDLAPRISCGTLYIVTHENMLRPNGSDAFDADLCLQLIERASVAGRHILAPVSAHNRATVAAWLDRRPDLPWTVAPFDWFNVFDLPLSEPVQGPRDRRGRHSRPGLEKFPPLATMRAHFPAHAERCAILGADTFLSAPDGAPPHWRAYRFRSLDVARFLEEIDFFVYFTHPLWRESFGRVIAEAIAAGKLVITDPGTAAPFGPGVVASDSTDVDALVAGFVAAPQRYARAVRQAQAGLARFTPERFREDVLLRVTEGSGGDAAVPDPADAGVRHASL
jgi:hypothetical protein